MFSVSVSDHVMIAHSLRGAVFGPAQRLHGATYVVTVTLRRPGLDADGIVADIGALTGLLSEVLEPLRYRNLDDEPAFSGVNTTTEVLARHLFDALAARIRAGALGGDTATALAAMTVTLGETPTAAAAYEGPLA